MCIRARRGVAITYVNRYFLKNRAKKEFFDFVQGELQWSLENLTKYIESDVNKFLVGEGEQSMLNLHEFERFRSEGKGMEHLVRKHFVEMVI